MKLIYISLLLTAFVACKQQNSTLNNEEDTTKVELSEQDISEENIKDGETEQEWSEEDYNLDFSYPPSKRDHMEAYLREYIPEENLEMFLNAPQKYEKIKVDTEFLRYYIEEIKLMKDVLDEVMYNSGIETEHVEDYANAWEWIKNYVPFLGTVWECSECDSEATIETYVLHEKAKTTQGEGDDKFFNLLATMGDSYKLPTNGNAGCDYCGYSKMGEGIFVEILRELIEVESSSEIIKEEINEIAKNLMNIDYLTVFGSSQKDVFAELDKLIELQDSTSFDLSNAKVLKEQLKAKDSDIIYECTFESFTSN